MNCVFCRQFLSKKMAKKPKQKPKKSASYQEHPTRQQIQAALKIPNYGAIPDVLEDLMECDFELPIPQLHDIANKLSPIHYNCLIELALDVDDYLIDDDDLERTRVEIGDAAFGALNMLIAVASKLNAVQLKECCNFFIALDDDLMDEYLKLFQSAKPELVLPVLEEYICNVTLPCAEKNAAAEIVRNIASEKPKFAAQCWPILFKALQEPIIRSLSPDTAGFFLWMLLSHTKWTKDEIAIIRYGFAKELIDTATCGDYGDFLYHVGGEALVWQHANDKLVSKCECCSNPHVLEVAKKKKSEKDETLAFLKQANTYASSNQHELAIMSYMDCLSMRISDKDILEKSLPQIIECYKQLGRYDDAWKVCAAPSFYSNTKHLQTLQAEIEKPLSPKAIYPTLFVSPATVQVKLIVKQYFINETIVDEDENYSRYCCLNNFPQVIFIRADDHIVVWNCNQQQRQLLVKYGKDTCTSITVHNKRLYALDATKNGVASYELPSTDDEVKQALFPSNPTTIVSQLGRFASPYFLYVDENWIFVTRCHYVTIAMSRKTGVHQILYTTKASKDALVSVYQGDPVVYLACADGVVRVFSLKWKQDNARMLHIFALHERSMPLQSGLMNILLLGDNHLLGSYDCRNDSTAEQTSDYSIRVWQIDSRKVVHCLKFVSAVSKMCIHEASGTLCVGHANGTITIFDGFTPNGIIAPVHRCTIQACKHRVDGVKWLKQDELLVASMFDRTVSHFTLQASTDKQLGACNHCKQWSAQNLRCSQCKAVHYCNITCQRADWPKHKLLCKKV